MSNAASHVAVSIRDRLKLRHYYRIRDFLDIHVSERILNAIAFAPKGFVCVFGKYQAKTQPEPKRRNIE